MLYPLLYALLVLALFAVWGLWPEDCDGVYPLSVDSHGRPTSPSLVGDTRRPR